jgi:hypothetical protein
LVRFHFDILLHRGVPSQSDACKCVRSEPIATNEPA